MSVKQELAAEFYNSGLNCSQSVLAVFCGDYGLDRETALKVVSGFGGGMRSGEICGAVSGAVIVIGLKYGQTFADDKESKRICNAKTKEFIKAFKEKNRSVVCREILKCDISTKEGSEQAKSGNLFGTACLNMVRSAVSLLEEFGY